MPTPTTRLRAVLQDPGSNLNTWGANLNTQAISLLDEAIAGVEKITLTGNLTLSSANYATDQARNAALVFSGTPASDVTVTVPGVEKTYVVVNGSSKTVTLSAGGTGAALAAGDRAVIWCDGTDCGFGTVTSAVVNGLIANAVLSPGTLPGQTGNAGKYLQTNGTVPLWAALPDVGGGADATITASVTLTASASVVQSVNMDAAGQSVTLPDATSLTAGGRKFVFLGVGNRTFGVRDNAGTLLTVVPAGGAAELHLRDNLTAAGAWGVTGRGLEPALTLLDHTAPTTITGAVETAVRLTDTLSLHFGTTASGFNALAVDSTAGAAAAGTWTAVEAAGAATVLHAFRISATAAIVFWTQAANHKAAVLTVTGTTIAVGTAASTTTAFLTNVTFTGSPNIAQLTSTLFVAQFLASAGVVQAVAISVSGTTITVGTAAADFASGTAGAIAVACYRISDTAALAIYTDDSGAAGSPYSLRAVVLSVSGTVIGVGTSAGIDDVTAATVWPTCQLTANKYVVGYQNSGSAVTYAASITVSGTTVTWGTPLTVLSDGAASYSASAMNASRFQPNLFRVSDTTALFSCYGTTATTFHAVLTESGGVLTLGAPIYSLWTGISGVGSGGNFPQTSAGFLAISSTGTEEAIFAVTISGTTLTVTGEFADGALGPMETASRRFGLSGGVCGVQHDSTARGNLIHLFRFVANGAPRYLGPLRLNNVTLGAVTPVEIAAAKVAVISGAGAVQTTLSTDTVRLHIVEFASA